MWAYLRPWEADPGIRKVTFNGTGVCDLTGLGFQCSSHLSAMLAVIHIWSITQISSPDMQHSDYSKADGSLLEVSTAALPMVETKRIGYAHEPGRRG